MKKNHLSYGVGKEGKSINPPKPISTRTCACGCGTEFQPRRSDNIYVTGTHADYDYNHKKRRQNNQAGHEIEKHLRRNDKILAKYFQAGNGKEAICFLINLKADGFDTKYYTGNAGVSPNFYFTMYNYIFITYEKEGQLLIKILKR